MSSRADEEKALFLFTNLDRSAFDFYYDTFASNEDLVDEAKNYSAVKAKFFQYFEKKKGPQVNIIIRQALDAVIDITDIPYSLQEIQRLYKKVGFDNAVMLASDGVSHRRLPS